MLNGDYTLSPCQEKARETFLSFLEGNEKAITLTGAPGTGKSFTTNLLIEDIRSVLGEIPIHLTATTNKAAAVLAGATGEEVTTIHSLLSLRVRNNIRTGRQDLIRSSDAVVIRSAFIVIDEVSMIDNDLWKAIDEGTIDCRFLLVGDADQLAPVGEVHPPVFDMGLPEMVLKTPMRQAEASGILELADQLRNTIENGTFTPLYTDNVDVFHITGEEFQNLVDTQFTEEIEADILKIVGWKNDTVRDYNNYIRKRHFAEEAFVVGEVAVTNVPIMEGSATFYSTDEFVKIMEVEKDTVKGVKGHWYKLDKGCRVFQADNQNQVKEVLKQLARSAKEGGSWFDYFAAKEFFGDLRAVHSCTAYKSQGSTYRDVFIDLSDIGDCRQWQQVARMLYVAITRAKRRVYLYGELPAKYGGKPECITKSSGNVSKATKL